jgi:O-6-methylguanine DNA methyltransferase
MTTPDFDRAWALALRAVAPARLPDRVLVDVGLVDAYASIDSPLGPLWVAWNGRGVAAVEAAPDGETFAANHVARTGRRAVPGVLPMRLERAISRRLDGDRRANVPLDLRGHTDFEQAVWMKALEIPRGQVRPYGWVAAEIGRPKAVRAVGSALGHNPVPLIVPCHRVVRTDGMLGQYSLGGPHNKRAILAAEGLDPDALEAQAHRGIRYIGSDTTRIMCLPTCHHAKRVTDAHRIPLRSFAAGLAAGYRPCKVCRPDSGAMVAA